MRLQENQVIDELYTKWWKKEKGGDKCTEEEGSPAGKAAELGVDNVGGVFVVLMGGVIVGFFVSLCEFMWKARKNAKKDKVRREFGVLFECPFVVLFRSEFSALV